ncbi:MAG: hypothetical protein ABH813_01675, partial [Patescibacteria group bacterium]
IRQQKNSREGTAEGGVWGGIPPCPSAGFFLPREARHFPKSRISDKIGSSEVVNILIEDKRGSPLQGGSLLTE